MTTTCQQRRAKPCQSDGAQQIQRRAVHARAWLNNVGGASVGCSRTRRHFYGYITPAGWYLDADDFSAHCGGGRLERRAMLTLTCAIRIRVTRSPKVEGIEFEWAVGRIDAKRTATKRRRPDDISNEIVVVARALLCWRLQPLYETRSRRRRTNWLWKSILTAVL